MSFEQDSDRWVRELREEGWKEWRGRWDMWVSPFGGIHRGPYAAWRVMRAFVYGDKA